MLAWGCLLAIAMQHAPRSLTRVVQWHPRIGRFFAVLVVYLAPWYLKTVSTRYGIAIDAWIHTVRAAAVAYLIASLILLPRGWSYRWLNSKPFVAVGVMSYSLYVWQQPFLGAHISWPWAVNLLIAFVIATASYHLVERPLRRFFVPRPRTSAAREAPAAASSSAFVAAVSPATIPS
jgi:peptidoglycan/LPS O-acetylase OafA/YrhL